MDHEKTKPVAGLAAHNYTLAQSVLADWEKYPWFIFPTGVLTFSVVGEIVMNVFDNSFSAGFNEYHTHIKGFRSWIMCGQLEHRRWRIVAEPDGAGDTSIEVLGHHAGADRKRTGTTKSVRIAPNKLEIYVPGDTYEVEPEEIHSVAAAPGTVTLLTTYECRRIQEEWLFNAVAGGTRGTRPASGPADKDSAAKMVAQARAELDRYLERETPKPAS